MAYWWEVIEEPKTLKAALELLTAIRTNQVLRNTICDVFSVYSGSSCNLDVECQRHPFHKLLDAATELRTRIIGPINSRCYGKYEVIYGCSTKTTGCNGTLRACSKNVRNQGCDSDECMENIHAFAEKVFIILLRVLLKLSITLKALFEKINLDGRLLYQRCDYENGDLYKWFTGCGECHKSHNCPFIGKYQLPTGFTKDDMKCKDAGWQIESVLKTLVGKGGSLLELAAIMRRIKPKDIYYANYISSEDLARADSKCTCEPLTTDVTRANGRVAASGRSRRSTTGTSQTRARRGVVTKPNVREGSTSKSRHRRQTSETASVNKDVQTEAKPVVTCAIKLDEATVEQNGTVTPPQIPTRQSELQGALSYTEAGGYSQNGILYFNNRHSSSSYNGYSPPQMQESTQQEPKACFLSSVPSGPAAVGGVLACVGVGAAYIFNLGGFKTMVNSLF
ncbi:rod shape-determining protein MreC [Babesia caballi]|uniref:Rod shape-determining protein MreC n=1 Tax=Babesia caballi TaxID=5871 RepID=A0AAV4M4B1_BABCB|nr:rod shape-determining protein MreC [Babesia caballi]